MAILSAMACSLSTFYPTSVDVEKEMFELGIIRMLAKMPTVAAFAYKKRKGQPYVYPRNNLDYAENLLNMMFLGPAETYELNSVHTRALDLFVDPACRP